MKEAVLIEFAEKPNSDHVKLTLQYRNAVVVRLESDNMFILMGAMLLALGFQTVQFQLYTSGRELTAQDVRDVVTQQPDAVFQCAEPQKGVVTVYERYSEELEEFRINLKVNGENVGTSVDDRFGLKTFAGVLLELDYDVFEAVEAA